MGAGSRLKIAVNHGFCYTFRNMVDDRGLQKIRHPVRHKFNSPGADGKTRFVSWFYDLPHVWVLVMFAEPGERRDGLVGAWHPSSGDKVLTMADFRYAEEPVAGT